MHRVVLAQTQLSETRAVLEQILASDGQLSFMMDSTDGPSIEYSSRWETPLKPGAFAKIGSSLRQMADPASKLTSAESAANGSIKEEGDEAEQQLDEAIQQVEEVIQEVEDNLDNLDSKLEPCSNGEASKPASGETQQPHTNEASVKSALRRADSSVHGSGKEEAELIELAEDIATDLGITAEEVKKAYSCFCEADDDHSGKVSTGELHGLLEAVSGRSVDKDACARILQIYDKDSDGELNFEEFLFCFCHTPHKRQSHLSAAVLREEDRLERHARLRVVGVPANILKNFLQKEVDEERAFLAIPVVFLLFLFFLLSVVLHTQTTVTTSVELAVRTDIENNANFALAGVAPFENARTGFHSIDDIGSFPDFWSWLDVGLAPLFFPSGWGVSEARSNVAARCMTPLGAMESFGWNISAVGSDTPYGDGAHAPLAGDLGSNMCALDLETNFPHVLSGLSEYGNANRAPYLIYNEIIAGMRLRQEQLPEVACRKVEYSGRAYKTPCIEINGATWLVPDLGNALDINEDFVNQPGGESVYIKSGKSLTEVRQSIRELENRRWANPRTSKIEIALTVLLCSSR
jgi:hypothetical protein